MNLRLGIDFEPMTAFDYSTAVFNQDLLFRIRNEVPNSRSAVNFFSIILGVD
jgi:hypothetical protein